MAGYVYIMGNASSSTLYVGVTSDLSRRVYEHRNHLVPGFTDKYNIERLLYTEEYADIRDAIAREKQLKGWSRKKKDALIDAANPERDDLAKQL